MAGDLAAKRSRAEELREELQVLRIKQTVDAQEADLVVQEAKLDDEIVQLEKQVAIAKAQAASGGSVTEAMDAMAEAARIEQENAAGLAAATATAVVTAPVETGDSESEVVTLPADAESTEPVVTTEPAPTGVPASGLTMGLVNPTGGND